MTRLNCFVFGVLIIGMLCVSSAFADNGLSQSEKAQFSALLKQARSLFSERQAIPEADALKAQFKAALKELNLSKTQAIVDQLAAISPRAMKPMYTGNSNSGGSPAGYSWFDSSVNDNNPNYQMGYYWLDISATGTPFQLCDETFVTLPLNFNFRLWDIPNNQITVNDNGVLFLGNQGVADWNWGGSCLPANIPSGSNSLTQVMVFGDYEFPGSECAENINPEGFSAFWEIRVNNTPFNTLSSPRILVVQFENVPDYFAYQDVYIDENRDPAELDTYTFQFIFYENSDNFMINIKDFITRSDDGLTSLSNPVIGSRTPANPNAGYVLDWVYWDPDYNLPEQWDYSCTGSNDVNIRYATIFFYISPPNTYTSVNLPAGDACVNPIISVYTEEGLIDMYPYNYAQPRNMGMVDGLFNDNDDDGGSGVVNDQLPSLTNPVPRPGLYDHMDAWFRYDTQEEDTLIIFDAVPASKNLVLIAQVYEWVSDEDPPAIIDIETGVYNCTALRPVRADFWPIPSPPGGMIRVEFPLPFDRLMPRKAYYFSVQAIHPAIYDPTKWDISDSTDANFDPKFYWAFQHGYTPENTCNVPPPNESCDRAIVIDNTDEYFHHWGCTSWTPVGGRPNGTNYYEETNTAWCLNPVWGKGLPMIGNDVVYRTNLYDGDYICVGQFAYFDSGIYLVGPGLGACMDVYNNCKGGSDVAFGSPIYPEFEYTRFRVTTNPDPSDPRQIVPGLYYFIIDSYSKEEFGDYEFFFYRLASGCKTKNDITGNIHVDNDFVCKGQSQLVQGDWDCGQWGGGIGLGGGASGVAWIDEEGNVISSERQFYWTFLEETTFELRVWCPGCIGFKSFTHTTPVHEGIPFEYGLTAELIPDIQSVTLGSAVQLRCQAACDLVDNPNDMDYAWYIQTMDQTVPAWHGSDAITFIAGQPPAIPDANNEIKIIVEVSCLPERGMCNATVSDTATIIVGKAKSPISTDLVAGEIRVGKAKFIGGVEALNLNFKVENPVYLASVKLFDMRGRLVRTLTVDASDDAGTFLANWDGRDSKGNLLPAGTYVWEIGAENNSKHSGVTVLTR